MSGDAAETQTDSTVGDPREPRTSDHLPRGSLVGRYVVLDHVGEGGMGVVYAAYDPELDRRVALKLMQAEPSGSSRLVREAQALARLAHPNVVAVHDVGTAGDHVFLAMELVDGVHLAAWLDAAPRTWREIVDVLVAAGRGLAAAHAAGVVHRDFKPSNVLVGKDGRARVLDFGLACGDGEASVSYSSGRTRHGALGDDLTVTGSVMGTPMYMPPEAARGEIVGPAGDQFSFCVALYEGLYGARPFDVRTSDELAPIPPAPASSRVPAWVRKIVLRGLAFREADRHPSMTALLAALQADPARTRRRIAVAGLAVLAAIALVAGTATYRDHVRGAMPDDPCDARTAPWTDATLARVHAAFDAAHAGDAFTRTSTALARWRDEWTAERTRACAATRAEHTQPEAVLLVRLACLDRQLDDTRALVSLLETADVALAKQGATAVRQLPRAAACANATTVSVPPVPPEELRARVASLDARLLQAAALDRIGRRAEAVERLTPLVVEARRVGHAPELAEILMTMCRVHDNANEPKQALPFCAEAELVATTSRMDAIAARAAAMRVELLAFAGDDPTSFAAAVSDARAWVDRDHDLVAELSLEQGLGIASQAKGNHEEAIEHDHRAAAIAVQIGNEDASTVQNLWNNEAFSLTVLGRYEDALVLQRKAIAALEASPRDADLLAGLLDNYGYNLVLAGRPEEARAPLERALVTPDLSGFVHGGLLCDLARVDLAEGNAAAAIAGGEDGVARLRAAGTTKFNLAINEDPLAAAYLAAGRDTDALALGQECLAEFRKDRTVDGPELVPCMAVVGTALARAGKRTEGRALLEHAVELERGRVAPHGLVEGIQAELARIDAP